MIVRTLAMVGGLAVLLSSGCKKAPRVDPLDRPIGVRSTVQTGVLDNGIRWVLDERKGEALTARVATDLGWVAERDVYGAAGRVAGALGEPGAPVDVRTDRFEAALPVDRRLEKPVALQQGL